MEDSTTNVPSETSFSGLPKRDDSWANPIRIGDTVEVQGMKFKIIKVKKLKKELYIKLEE